MERASGYFTYFIRQVGTGFIKIGRAADPLQRIRALQGCCPQDVELLLVLPDSGETRERVLLERFRTSHFRAEWYYETDEILSFVRERSSLCLIEEIKDAAARAAVAAWEGRTMRSHKIMQARMEAGKARLASRSQQEAK